MLEIFGGLEIFAQIGFHLSQGGTDPRGESGGGRFAGHGGWKHKQVECLAVPWRGNLLFCFHGCGGCCRLPLWYFLRYLAATWSAVILNTSLALTAMMSLGKRFCNFAFWTFVSFSTFNRVWSNACEKTTPRQPHANILTLGSLPSRDFDFRSHHTISWLFFCVCTLRWGYLFLLVWHIFSSEGVPGLVLGCLLWQKSLGTWSYEWNNSRIMHDLLEFTVVNRFPSCKPRGRLSVSLEKTR